MQEGCAADWEEITYEALEASGKIEKGRDARMLQIIEEVGNALAPQVLARALDFLYLTPREFAALPVEDRAQLLLDIRAMDEAERALGSEAENGEHLQQAYGRAKNALDCTMSAVNMRRYCKIDVRVPTYLVPVVVGRRVQRKEIERRIAGKLYRGSGYGDAAHETPLHVFLGIEEGAPKK